MKQAVEYDVFLPVMHNDGSPVAPEVISEFKNRLFKEFGGLTDFRHSSEGFWNVGGVTFRDDILILRVISRDPGHARTCLAQLKQDIKNALDQQEVLMVERAVFLV